MLKSRNFYLILLLFGIGAFSGLMIASNASLIGQNMFKLTAGIAATYVVSTHFATFWEESSGVQFLTD